MHELSIAESIVDVVRHKTGDQRVEIVRVRIGELTAVVPDALLFCFDLATQGTPLQGARLDIELQPARGRCQECGDEFVIPDLIPLCPCGSVSVDVLTGRDLQVASVEVA